MVIILYYKNLQIKTRVEQQATAGNGQFGATADNRGSRQLFAKT